MNCPNCGAPLKSNWKMAAISDEDEDKLSGVLK